MNALTKVDMAEVTRLTRAGKLAEAVALLQGTTKSDGGWHGPARSEPSLPSSLTRPAPTIDMIAPATRGGAWTAPRAAKFMDALRGRAPGLGEGLAAPSEARVRVPEGAKFEERDFANDAGHRAYKVFVPSGYAGQPVPVVVMLHGCTQDPDDFAAGTRMNEVAEEQTFLVAYPRQAKSANMRKCWNWFRTEDQRREGGEPSLIAGIALAVVEEFAADPTRVYVAGLSAGGAAAAIMGATYPELFAAIGVHSGLACGAAADMPSAFAAMSAGGAAPATGTGPARPAIVFHGDADRTVNVANGDHVVAQARARAALTRSVTHGETPDGARYTRAVERDASGREVLEQWTLHGAGHAWSGGSADGSYASARGPDASREMVRFFLAHANPPR